MGDLRWSWLGAPYLAATAVIFAVAVAAALTRGDRVLRLGVIAAAVTTLPWSVCQAMVAFTDDPGVATRLLRIGQGPVAQVGPNLLLVLLGANGQLERHRWIARIAGVVGAFFVIVTWTTTWVVPGVQRLPSGLFYVRPGPLTGLHISQLVLWLGVGLLIVRRSSRRADQRRMTRFLLGVLACGALGSLDTLLLYRVWGVYPVSWLPASVAAGIAFYLVIRTDLLRPQGFDRGIAIELVGFVISIAIAATLAVVLGEPSPLALAAVASIAWVAVTGTSWAIASRLPVRVAGERALEQFVARVAILDDDAKIVERIATLWKRTLGIDLRAAWSLDGRDQRPAGGAPEGQGGAFNGEAFAEIGGDRRWTLEPELVAWLVQHHAPLALSDLGTMRLGALRTKVEGLAAAHGVGLIVPLVDRGELIGLVEADYPSALREDERGLVAESARAAARALTFVGMARAAGRELETEREVEVADALRLQASASRDSELGRWAVAAEYRTAPRTTGAGWSAIELADGRLALLATEAQAHGVAAALATAALTGAFAAATTGRARLTLDDLLATMRASADGVMRGGEPVAAFLAILDATSETVEWACAGHPGAFLVGPIALVDTTLPLGSMTGPRPQAIALGAGTRAPDPSLAVATRGTTRLGPDTLLVVASTALRGDDDASWQTTLRELAPASGRLASVLVDNALRAGEPREDLLAVVVRSRHV